jgi:sec-independent protein translocase protein TatB
MFDIGFSELLVIGVVALLVIGPERLPKVARTAGHLFGRLQRYVNDVKADIQREVELDELRKLRTQFEDAARSVEQSVNQIDTDVRQASNELSRAVSGDAPAGETPAQGAPAPDTAAALPGAPASPPGTPAAATEPQQPRPA